MNDTPNAGPSPVVDDTEAPEALARLVSGRLAAAIGADADVQAGQRDKLLQLVHIHFLPYTWTMRTTMLTMGRHWRAASFRHREMIVDAYRDIMLYTYAEAMAQAKHGGVRVEPASIDEYGAIVRTHVDTAAGASVALDYRLAPTEAGCRIYDLKMEDQWFIHSHQQSFQAAAMQGGCDGLYAMLEAKRAALAARLGFGVR